MSWLDLEVGCDAFLSEQEGFYICKSKELSYFYSLLGDILVFRKS